MRAGRAVDVQHAGDEIADGDSQMTPEAALQAGIILRAAEEVAHQLTENRAAADELHHARRYRIPQERPAVKAPDDARGKFQFAGEGRFDPGGIFFRAALRERPAKQFAGAYGVKEAFAGEGIDPGCGVADERPVFSENAAFRKCAFLRGGQNVAIKLGVFRRDVLFLDKSLQVAAELCAGMRGHAAADSDG